MLSFNQVALRRGTELLFEDVTFTIHKGRKVGLIGANGAGKSSLFKMIIRELEADLGDVEMPANLRIAHLEQEIQATNDLALDYVLGGDTELTDIQAKLKDVEATEKYDQIALLHEKLDAIDGYTAKSRAEQLLVGLGFSEEEFRQPLKDFSGGWRIRLNLARTLMTPSDLLLLDEPTNHLDLESIQALNNSLINFKGTVLFSTHDHEFAQTVANRIIEITPKGAIDRYSTFDDYLSDPKIKELREKMYS